MNRKRVTQLLAGFALSAVLLWLTLRQISVAEVRRALQQAQMGYVALATATYFVDVGVRTWRWQILLRPVRSIGWRRLYPVTILGYMGNALLPARMGELVRAAALTRRGVAMSAGLGSIATERVLDGLTTVAIVLVASRFLALPDWLLTSLVVLTVVFLAALLVLVALLFARSRIDPLMDSLCRRAPSLQRPRKWLEQFIAGLGVLRDPRLLGSAVLIGLLAWTSSALQCFWVFRAFGLPLGAAAAFFVVSAVGLSSAVPAAPGYVGSFEFAGVGALGLLGIRPGPALSAILTIHLLQIVPVTIAGMFFAWREGFTLSVRPESPAHDGG